MRSACSAGILSAVRIPPPCCPSCVEAIGGVSPLVRPSVGASTPPGAAFRSRRTGYPSPRVRPGLTEPSARGRVLAHAGPAYVGATLQGNTACGQGLDAQVSLHHSQSNGPRQLLASIYFAGLVAPEDDFAGCLEFLAAGQTEEPGAP